MTPLDELRELVERLRRECPWDRAQTLASLRPYLLEEAYEVLGALDSAAAEPTEAHLGALREELGDLLFQVYLLARILDEHGGGDLHDVARGIGAKMVERHPHVFGPGGATEEDGSVGAWEARKAAARAGRSRVDGVPPTLPALLRAHRVAEKVAHVGFDWPDLASVLAKVDEERAELTEAIASGDRAAIAAEYGDLLLACANVGRFLDIPGEDALRAANEKFERRFREVERRARAAGVALEDAGLDRLEGWWQDAKRCESSEAR